MSERPPPIRVRRASHWQYGATFGLPLVAALVVMVAVGADIGEVAGTVVLLVGVAAVVLPLMLRGQRAHRARLLRRAPAAMASRSRSRAGRLSRSD